MADLLTQFAYAKRVGKPKQNINRLVKEGKIILVNGKVDVAQADAAIADWADPTRTRTESVTGYKATQAPARGTIAETRQIKLHLEAQLKKIELDEKIGKVLQADVLHAELAKLFTGIKTRIRSLAPKCAQGIVAKVVSAHKNKKTEHEIIILVEAIISKEHDDALVELSTWKP